MRRHKTDGSLVGMFDQVKPYAHRAQKRALKAQQKAQKKAGPVVEQAWDRVAPAVENAKDRLGPAVDNARDQAEAAMSAALVASEPYRQEAMKRGTAAWLALRGDLRAPNPKKSRHWVRNILLLGGIGGSAYVAYRILRNGTASEWLPKQATTPQAGTAESTKESEHPETTEAADTQASETGMSGKHTADSAGAGDGMAAKEPAGSGPRSATNRTTRSSTNRKPGDLPKN